MVGLWASLRCLVPHGAPNQSYFLLCLAVYTYALSIYHHFLYFTVGKILERFVKSECHQHLLFCLCLPARA